MDDEELRRRLWTALFDQLGGSEAVAMTNLWSDGVTYEDIGRRFGCTKGTAHKKVARLRSTLSAHGLLPKRWAKRRRVSNSGNKGN